MRSDRPRLRTSATPDRVKRNAAGHDDLLTNVASLPCMQGIEEGRESPGDPIRRIREIRGLTIRDVSIRTGIDTVHRRRIVAGFGGSSHISSQAAK